MNTISSNIGLTTNGNQYKKSKSGSRAGALIGAAGPVVIGAAVALNEGLARTGKQGKITIKDSSAFLAGALFASLGIITGFIGKAIGSTIDAKTNKERMAQADGKAARENSLNKQI